MMRSLVWLERWLLKSEIDEVGCGHLAKGLLRHQFKTFVFSSSSLALKFMLLNAIHIFCNIYINILQFTYSFIL